jgi:hypothetical protein
MSGQIAAEPAIVRTVHPVERWRLPGDIDGTLLGKVTSVVADDAGNVFVFDVKGCRIHVLRVGDGTLVRSFGQCGEGPGDIGKGQALFSASDDAIGIVNLMPPAIQYLGHDGRHISTLGITLDQKVAFVTLNRARPCDDGYIAEGLANLPDMSQVRYLSFLDDEGKESLRLVSLLVAEAGRTFMDEILMNKPRWVFDPFGSVYVSDRFDEYRIDVFSITGEEQRTINRSYDRLRRSDEEIDNLKRLEGKYQQSGASARMEFRQKDFHRDIEDLHVLDNGRLLVLTGRGARPFDDPTSMGSFEMYDSGTAPIAKVRLVGQGNPLHDAYFFEGRYLFVVTEALPPYRDCYRPLEREIPYMTVICYDVSELTEIE